MNDRAEIALIRRERINAGQCPCCGVDAAIVRNWVVPDRSSDAWRVLYDDGIDPKTGHLLICQEK